MEMLVTLVIVSMVVVVLMQALLQLGRVEKRMEEGQLRNVAADVRAEWVRQALEAMLPGTLPEERLRGTERELTALSAEVPMASSPELGILRLRLRTDASRNTTHLELLPRPGADGREQAVALLSWPGAGGRFRFMDKAGAWHERWPPQDSRSIAVGNLPSPAVLPQLVELSTDGANSWLLAAPRASDSAVFTRRQAEAL